MYDIGGVKSFKCAKCLVDEVLGVVVGEVLRSDDAVHVGFHKFLNYCILWAEITGGAAEAD